jgi:hypothetical protein
MSPYRSVYIRYAEECNTSLLVPSLPYMGVSVMAEGTVVSHGPVQMCLNLV